MWRVTDLVGWPALGVFGIIFAPFLVGDMTSLRLGVEGGVVGVGAPTVLAELVSTMIPLERLFCLRGAAGSFFDCLRGGAGGGATGGGGAVGAIDVESGKTGAVSVGTGGSFFLRGADDAVAEPAEGRRGLAVASAPCGAEGSNWSTAMPESAESVREKDTFRSAGGPYGPPSPPAIVADGELNSCGQTRVTVCVSSRANSLDCARFQCMRNCACESPVLSIA